MKNLSLCAAIAFAFCMPTAQATEPSNINLVFGLSQPMVLHGGNIEIDYITPRWVFEYSHGFALSLDANSRWTKTDAERAQKLAIYVPYSTGGGIGYRFTDAFNVRLEIKQHRYEVAHPSGEKVAYIAQDVGVGAYYFYKPLANKGLIIVPSVRYWPTLRTSLDSDRHTFANGDIHKAHTFGLFTNVSIGWQF